jgi:flagellar hook-basal body complex protein FliE
MKNEKSPVIEQLPAQPVTPEMSDGQKKAQEKIEQAKKAFEETITEVLKDLETEQKDAAKEMMPA